MTKKRLKEAEHILAAYIEKYGLIDEARDYFAKWNAARQYQTVSPKSNSWRGIKFWAAMMLKKRRK